MRRWLHGWACLLAALAGWGEGPAAVESTGEFPGWPVEWDGAAIRRLPLTSREEGFARTFPGRVGRFTDGEREIILRWVSCRTRQLHPAADCFRGSGYRVEPSPLARDGAGRAWGAFTAEKAGRRLRVRERVVDGQGRAWTDVSAWYWAALWGRTEGPWWAATVAEGS